MHETYRKKKREKDKFVFKNKKKPRKRHLRTCCAIAEPAFTMPKPTERRKKKISLSKNQKKTKTSNELPNPLLLRAESGTKETCRSPVAEPEIKKNEVCRPVAKSRMETKKKPGSRI